MKNIKLSTLSEVSQIISALAVVVSLIYVGAQINQNTKATQAAMRQAIADNDITYLMTSLDNSVLALATHKYAYNLELSEFEKSQLFARQHVNFRVFENAFYQYQQGLLEPETWGRYRRIIKGLLTNDDAANRMWSRMNKSFTQSFQNEVSSIVANNDLYIIESNAKVKTNVQPVDTLTVNR